MWIDWCERDLFPQTSLSLSHSFSSTFNLFDRWNRLHHQNFFPFLKAIAFKSFVQRSRSHILSHLSLSFSFILHLSLFHFVSFSERHSSILSLSRILKKKFFSCWCCNFCPKSRTHLSIDPTWTCSSLSSDLSLMFDSHFLSVLSFLDSSSFLFSFSLRPSDS